MKKLIIIALIMALITGFSVYLYADKLEKNFKVKTLPVVVAINKIPKNTLIIPEMVTVKQLPQVAVNVLSAKSVSDVVGRVTKENIEMNEPILTTKLNEPGNKDNTLFYTIKEGYRALTIKTDEVSGVAGYINKGDRIDILSLATSKDVGITSMVLVEDVEVLEVGTRSAEKVAGHYSSITVSIKVEDVLMVNYYLSEGKNRFVLRSVLQKENIVPPTYVP